MGSFAPEETIRLYTDACHEEPCVQTGKEVLDFGKFLTGSELRYINVDDRDTIIAELEALRVLIGVEPLSQRYPHHDAVVFLDKEAVLASIAIVAEVECLRDLRLWFERVPSHSKPADGPSRGSLDRSAVVSCDTSSFVNG